VTRDHTTIEQHPGETLASAYPRARREFREDWGYTPRTVRHAGDVIVAFGPDWGRRELLEFTVAEQRRIRAARARVDRLARERRERVARARVAAIHTLHTHFSSFAIESAKEIAMPLDPILERALYNSAFYAPVTAFPATAKKGAKVRLTSKTHSHLKAEFVIGVVTQELATGRVTHIAPEGVGTQKYGASSYHFELLEPAPVPLPTETGLYAGPATIRQIRSGRIGARIFVRENGLWHSYPATGGNVRSETEASIRDYIGEGSTLTKLVPAS
jgi:hypothetical protein